MADLSEHLELRGEVGALIGSRDWSKTPLGPLEAWPSSLRTMIGVMLGSRFPMMLGWGPDLLQFYNDAYLPVLGVKHPDSLGAPVSAVWSEIWTVVGPLMLSVLSGGPALWREHELLFINSRGFAQETFHTFSQSPVPGDDGKVGGVLLTVQETTEQVQGERQLQTLRVLAERTGLASTATEACVVAASVLDSADADVPFSLVYLLGEDGAQRAGQRAGRVVGGAGAAPGDVAVGPHEDRALGTEPAHAQPGAARVVPVAVEVADPHRVERDVRLGGELPGRFAPGLAVLAGDQQEPPRRDEVLDRAAAVLVVDPGVRQRGTRAGGRLIHADAVGRRGRGAARRGPAGLLAKAG